METEKIEIVQNTLEIDQEAAKMALKLADGDVDEALKMEHYVDDKYIITQGKLIYGDYNKFYGLFILLADGKEGEVIKSALIVSDEQDDIDISLRVDSKVFFKTIEKTNNNVPKQESNLRLILNNGFKPAKLFEMLERCKSNDVSGVKQIIKSKFERELEEEIDLKLRVKSKTKTQLKKLHPDLFSVEESTDNSDNEEEEKLGVNITLNCIPIVSPTFGQKITSMDIGDQLLVKVVDQREVGRYLNKLLSTNVGAVVGTIEEIDFSDKSERYSVLIRLSSNVYGKVYVESEIKLSTPESEQEKMERIKSREENENNNKGMITILILSTLIIILLGIIIKLYL